MPSQAEMRDVIEPELAVVFGVLSVVEPLRWPFAWAPFGSSLGKGRGSSFCCLGLMKSEICASGLVAKEVIASHKESMRRSAVDLLIARSEEMSRTSVVPSFCGVVLMARSASSASGHQKLMS